ncbi:adenylosuccinate synthase [Stutzerimonas nitrititolerans]|uniref:adenylosuccinate synthase n=1 Tax=Stutzerimonas nitrititolerans TaxID=2482751 RepID=UPI0028AE4CDE|nr:adenylosuccinate synthase [Stutzerimonas nitrititolerans]
MAFELTGQAGATHDELTALAVKWLKRPFSARGPGCNIAMAELRSGYVGEIPDAIGFRLEHPGSVSVVVEVKVSRADFLADRKKPHRIAGGMGSYRYFMCPEGLIQVDELPPCWGLLWVNGRGHVKPKAGPAAYADGRYDTYTEQLDAFRHEPDLVREQWLLIKLLANIGDPEEANRKRKALYRERDHIAAQGNIWLKERDEAREENRKLKRELRLLGPVIPRVARQGSEETLSI